jgi:hypothetical protein
VHAIALASVLVTNDDSAVFDPFARLDDASIADELDEPRPSFEQPGVAERHDNIGDILPELVDLSAIVAQRLLHLQTNRGRLCSASWEQPR